MKQMKNIYALALLHNCFFELLHLHEDVIGHGVGVDKWTHCTPCQHELVSRIFRRKQFLIIAPNWPHNTLVNTMGERLRKFLQLLPSLLFLLAIVLFEHLLGRAFHLHDTDVLLRDHRLFNFF